MQFAWEERFGLVKWFLWLVQYVRGDEIQRHALDLETHSR